MISIIAVAWSHKMQYRNIKKNNNMMNIERQAEILNDLVKINNDRVEGYRKAIEELKPEDADLRILFQERIGQSQAFHRELAAEVAMLGEVVATGTMASGKIYRTWMDVKAFFSGSDRKTILDNCENGEDAALVAYRSALESDDLIPSQRDILLNHFDVIKVSHDEIRALRDVL